jgi:hypothetical protein
MFNSAIRALELKQVIKRKLKAFLRRLQPADP